MRRREFIALSVLSTVWPSAGKARSSRVRPIGWGFSRAALSRLLRTRYGLPSRKGWLPWVISMSETSRWRLVLRGAMCERLPALAEELAALRVDVIVVFGPGPMRAAKDAAGSIPIVMAAGSSDPVAERVHRELRPPKRERDRAYIRGLL